MKILNMEIEGCDQCPYIEWRCADNGPPSVRDGYHCNNNNATKGFIISEKEVVSQREKTGSGKIDTPGWCPLPDKADFASPESDFYVCEKCGKPWMPKADQHGQHSVCCGADKSTHMLYVKSHTCPAAR